MADYGIWQMVGVLVMVGTIPLMISPLVQSLFKQAYFKIRYLLQPGGSKCATLSWNDIPEGRTHRCLQLDPDPWRDPSNEHHICGNVSVPAKNDCWRHSILTAFNNTTTTLMVERPDLLVPEIHPIFLKTDLRTLFAFLLLTASINISSWVPSAQQFGDVGIKFRENGEILVARIHGSLKTHSYGLAKGDLDKILDGYPPFYRKTFKVLKGPVLPFPIREKADITRAGWIIAVGLTSLSLDSRPVALYTAKNDDNGYRCQGKPFRMAISRAKEVIEILSQHFPDDSAIPLVIAALQGMIDRGSISGLAPFRLALGEVGISVFPPDAKLDAKSYMFAMEIFNTLVPLTPEEVERLRPILHVILQATLGGSARVIDYLSRSENRLDLSLVEKYGWDHPVYVEGCRC